MYKCAGGQVCSSAHIPANDGTQMPSGTCHPIQRNPAQIDHLSLGSSSLPCTTQPTHRHERKANERCGHLHRRTWLTQKQIAYLYITMRCIPCTHLLPIQIQQLYCRMDIRCIPHTRIRLMPEHRVRISAKERTHKVQQRATQACTLCSTRTYKCTNQYTQPCTALHSLAQPCTTVHNRAQPCTARSIQFGAISTTAAAGVERVPRTTPSLRTY